MRVFDHDADTVILLGQANLRRYAVNGVAPALVIDPDRGITKPSSSGLFLSGSFDIDVDGTDYIGLSAPFVLPDFGQAQVRAFPSSAPVAVDYLLQPGGGRNAVPADSFVPGDNDIWSVGNNV